MKIKNKLNILFLTLFLTQIFHLPKLNSFDVNIKELQNLNFYEWCKKCKNNQISEKTFLEIIKQFNETCLNTYKKSNISNTITPHVSTLLTSELETTYVVGDLHGRFPDLFDIFDSIIKKGKFKEIPELNKNIKLNNANFIFLGDYTDRGTTSLEVLATIMLLKIINPNNVILNLGNHENLDININYGFFSELKIKLKNNLKTFIKNLIEAYKLMPAATYLKLNEKKFILCSHAGFEFRYNPKKFLTNLNNDKIQLNTIELIDFDNAPNLLKNNAIFYPQFLLNDHLINFCWADILYENETDPFVEENQSRGYDSTIIKYNEVFLEEILKEYKLEETFVKFIRGHQHMLPKGPCQNNKGKIYELTSGVTNLNEKIITLISASIEDPINPENTIKYYPTYLKITPYQNGEFNIESKSIKLKPFF